MCDKSFSSDTYMKKYMTSVHEERKAFKCTFCEKVLLWFSTCQYFNEENPWSGNQKRLSKNCDESHMESKMQLYLCTYVMHVYDYEEYLKLEQKDSSQFV